MLTNKVNLGVSGHMSSGVAETNCSEQEWTCRKAEDMVL